MAFEKKIFLKSPISWEHHRHGWKETIDCIKTNFECSNGVWFYSHIETETLSKIVIKKPWIAFMHNTPQHPPHLHKLYGETIYIDNFLTSKTWIDSSKYCQGIFVLSEYCRKYFEDKVKVPVNSLYHPTTTPDLKFDLLKFSSNKNKKIILIGHWLRNFESFDYLNSTIYPKFWLKCGPFPHEYTNNDTVKKLERVNNQEYDMLLSENLVFLDFYDTSANNALLECISRNTPVLIRKLSAVVEYLGEEYPFYFENLSEAEHKLKNIENIIKTHLYLKNVDKTKFTYEYFLNSFGNSNIYKNLRLKKIY
jgi:hypothetical protein